jgi:hypothetical protein
MLLHEWRYSKVLGPHRVSALEAAPSFEEITDSVIRTMKVECQHVDPCDESPGRSRVVYCAAINPSLFDLFFNSANGYRAFYYRSPEDGLRANGAFVSSAASKLFASGLGNAAPDLIARSLGVPSAKVWVAEVGKGWCRRCSGDWKAPTDDEAEILNGRWECSDSPNSRYGRKAPPLGMLRILGGFVGDQEGEYVPNPKRHRATDIHDWGWS